MDDANTYQRKVFGNKLEERGRLIRSLDQCQDETANRIARKLSACCRSPSLHANDDDTDIKLVEQRCKSRICPRCTQFRTWRLIARMMPIVKTADAPRFLTLTVKHNHKPLAEQITDMTRAFGKLRRMKLWKQKVTGGLYTIEIKWSPRSNAWHPHVHAIIDGQFFPHAQLKSAWQNVTDGSSIVDIRKISSRRNAVTYVAKYAAKAAETNNIPADRLPEWAASMHGLRMAQTFGTMHGVKVDQDDDDAEFPPHAAFIGPLIYEADNGNQDAAKLIDTVFALANRRLPDDDPVAAAEHVDRLKAALASVRAFQRRHEDLHNHAVASTRSVHSRAGPVHDGTIGLWEDDGDQLNRVGIPD